MAQQARTSRLTIDEYLQGELHSEVRNEYVNGEVYAMVGASAAHNIIAGNLFVALHQHLTGGPCQVFMADMKTLIRSLAEERFYYPDVQVCCDPDDQATYYRERPRLIIEVLSETTERRDRSDKFYAYRRLESLQEYVLVAQDVVRVEVYRRRTGWNLEIYADDDNVRLESVDLTVSVAGVYESAPVEAEILGNGGMS